MDNQHRKINGYRELTEEDIDLMNLIKLLGPEIENVLIKVENYIATQRLCNNVATPADKRNQLKRMDNATPERFLALAKTHLQTGLMYATRAVAQPEFF